jgi:hypothetical protein
VGIPERDVAAETLGASGGDDATAGDGHDRRALACGDANAVATGLPGVCGLRIDGEPSVREAGEGADQI